MTPEEKKEKNRQYYRDYYAKNKDKIQAANKKYLDKNKDRQVAYRKRWRKENKEYLASLSREHRKNNWDEYKKYMRKYNREYNLAHKDEIRQKYLAKIETIPAIAQHFIIRARKRNELDFDVELLKTMITEAFIKFGDMISCTPNSLTKVSLDRIDSNHGYSKDNIQIIPKWLNYAYDKFDKEEINREIIKFAKYLTESK
jgi:hypothetical protein